MRNTRRPLVDPRHSPLGRAAAALLLAFAALALPRSAPAADSDAHQVSVLFTPPSIFVGERSTLVIDLQGGSRTTNAQFSLALVQGLSVSDVTALANCGTGVSIAQSSASVNVSGITLGGGARCTINVQVAASLQGTYVYLANSNSWSYSRDNSNGNAAGAALRVDPSPVEVAPAALAFGAQEVGTRSAAQSVTLSNRSASAFSVTSTTAPDDFGVDGCSGRVEAGASCTMSVTFSPRQSGATAGALAIATSAGVASVSLSGTGISALAEASPVALAFGTVFVGSDTVRTVSLRNTGTAALAVSAVEVSGAFSLASHDCTASLAHDQACTASVRYQPAAIGSHTGQLTFRSNARNAPTTVAISGIAEAAPSAYATLAPASVPLGSVILGSSASAVLRLGNTGNATLHIQSISVGGAGFARDNTGTTCAGQLAARASCDIKVTFSPSATGAHAGQVVVQSNASNGAVSALLSGTGTPAPGPTASLSRASVDFGSQAVSTTSPAQTVVLANGGDAPLSIGGVTVSGDFAASGCAAGQALEPGAACTLSITFRPAASGARAGSVSVTSNAPGSPHVVSLAGHGTAPGVSLAPSPLAFGARVAGSSITSNVVLRNTGSAPLAVSGIVVSGAFFSHTHACPAILAAEASCAIAVTYAPATAGSHAGQLSVQTNAQAAAYVVALSGSASPPPRPEAQLSRASVAFGAQLLGTTSVPQVVVLTNAGDGPLAIASVSASGDFEASGCAGSVAPGASCTLSIVFRPTVLGDRSGAVHVASNAAGSPHTISLSGLGFATPGITFAPAAVEFGSLPNNSTSLRRVVVGNPGQAPLAISSIAVTGQYFSHTHTCPATLAPAGSCDVWVTYAPATVGAHAGELRVASNAADAPSVVPLQGTSTPATPPTLELSPGDLDFGAQTLGTASAARTVVLRNTGSSSLDVVSISATGDFGFTGCGTPVTLPAGGSCALQVKFVPTAVGPRAGSIAVSHTAAETPATVMLAGTGTPAPVPGIAVSPTSVDFGSLLVGKSLVIHIAVTNTGSAPLAIAGIGLVPRPPFEQESNCPASLAPSAACEISVTFAPTEVGAHSGQLTIQSNAAPGQLLVPLSGTALAVPAPGAQLSRTNVAFPSTFVGSTSAPQAVTLTNTGNAPLAIRSIASTGDFGYAGCGFPTTLAAGDACSFSITFRPHGVGDLTGAIEIVTDAPSSPHRIMLSGTGAAVPAPAIELTPRFVDFGALRVGGNAMERIRLVNAGNATLRLHSISVRGAYFSLVSNCPDSLAAGAECGLVVIYAPMAAGAHGAQLHIDSNAVPSPHVLALSGDALPLPPPFLETSRTLDFGQQVAGTPGHKTLQLRNSGEVSLEIASLRIFGSDAFVVEQPCRTIAPAASCALGLAFTPPATGEFAARLDIVSNHADGVVQVELSGAGIPAPLPDLELSVDGLGFGNQVVGTASEARTVRVTSKGLAPVRIDAVHGSPDYVVDASQCLGTLVPGRSCDIGVTFRPLVPGPRAGRLAIESNAAGAPHSVSLTGIGCRHFAIGAARNPDRLCAP